MKDLWPVIAFILVLLVLLALCAWVWQNSIRLPIF